MTINVFGGGNTGGPAFPLQRSVRLRSSASAYFNRTPASATNRQKYTLSLWFKRGTLSTNQALFSASDGTQNNEFLIYFDTNNALVFQQTVGGSAAGQISCSTSAVFRDPSSWYHAVVAIDTTQATSTNRLILYINGIAQTFPSYSVGSSINTWVDNTNPHALGKRSDASLYFDGYMTEVNFVDGQALTPASFGSINSTTGVWQPIKYSGTYGTNGFYLNFQDNSGATATTIGKDSSGNGNNWTPNNISVTAGVTYDSMLDVPTNTGVDNANFCTGNPLDNSTTLSNANLTVSATANTGVTGTISLPSSGSFYWETTVTTSVASGNSQFGMIGINQASTVRNLTVAGIRVVARSDGLIVVDSTTVQSGLTAWSSGDVFGCAYNATTNSLQFYRNNSTYGTAVTPTAGNTFVPHCGCAVSGTSVYNWNFGQRPFTYTPPTGFKSLNTYNLPAPTIPNGATQFAATTYTGNGSTQSITNTVNGKSFQPDFVWVKGRSTAYNHILANAVAGITNFLNSNTTNAESNTAGNITSVNADGFSVGSSLNVNQNAATQVAWQWKASNAAPVTNTSGSISSQVSANPTAGFSIVTYTGTGANATVGHGLGIAPSMVIVKIRTGVANDWVVYHKNLTSAAYCVFLNLTNAQFNTPATFNSTAPTSTVFSVGTGGASNTSTSTYVAYCFSEIAGYSKAFSYTGNGSTDGVFSYLGFRPRMILLKRTDTTGNWYIWDTSRNTYNVVGEELYPNLSNAAATATDLDLLSNGFKLRNSTAGFNASGGTYVGFAWAESPFSYSLAR